MLKKARDYEALNGAAVPEKERPAVHLTPYIGWMNDPNGFSFYKGQVHMFYQYWPYDINWGPMHWGHAVTEDLMHWTYLPCALAPDMPYESGCYSGTAAQDGEGRHVLMYTAHLNEPKRQQQCMAYGDGENYVKETRNPVITSDMLPEEIDPAAFRDPKLFYRWGRWNCLTVAKDRQGMGRVLYFTSQDLKDWTYRGAALLSDEDHGRMWECPDLIFTDEGEILCVSCEQLPEGRKYPGGHEVLFFAGRFDPEKGTFVPDGDWQMPDIGTDFYAPETLKLPDGRNILIGWLQNWDNRRDPKCDRLNTPSHFRWAGMMTVPRQIFLKDGKVCMLPVRELEDVLDGGVCEETVLSREQKEIEGVRGRTAYMELDLEAGNAQSVTMRFAKNDAYETRLVWEPAKKTLTLDRRDAGMDPVFSGVRVMHLEDSESLSLKILLDRFSAEIFLADGTQAMTASVFTPQEAEGITFCADKDAKMRIRCRQITK